MTKIREGLMNNEEKKIGETSAAKWHPNAPLNPAIGAEQAETDFNASQDRPQDAETPVSTPKFEDTKQVLPPVTESDDSLEHQWRAGGGASPEPRH